MSDDPSFEAQIFNQDPYKEWKKRNITCWKAGSCSIDNFYTICLLQPGTSCQTKVTHHGSKEL